MTDLPISQSLLLAVAALSFAAPAYGGQSEPPEPTPIESSVEQDVDMVYFDKVLHAYFGRRSAMPENAPFGRDVDAQFDPMDEANPLYTDLRRGLVRYRMEWAALPQFAISTGPTLRLGSSGERVASLRERLGLPAGDQFDQALTRRLTDYQNVHGLKSDGVVGNGVIASLNLGARHYEQVLMINMERAARLPAPGELRRHIMVDAGSAMIFIYENGSLVDSMRAVVGSSATKTPMMAAPMSYASVSPYWNVPPDLNGSLIARRVLDQGIGYLTERKYEVFADWSDEARPLDPATVDWQAVREGKLALRIRRRPGPGNSMGDIKFMIPNNMGIFLHDTHDKTVFQKDDRWISNGCVRVEDAHRLAAWLFGAMPKAGDPDVEERVNLPEPVPVFLTYLTAAATGEGVRFRADPYNRDAAVLNRYFGDKRRLAAVGRE